MYFYRCPHCQKEVQVEDNMAGQTMTCPHCSKSFTIPDLNGIPMAQMNTTPAQPQNLPLATSSMIWGIISFIGVPFCGLVALITGIISTNKISRSNGLLLGKGKAITGIVFGIWSIIRFPIMLGILLPALNQARNNAIKIACVSNMKNIALAVVQYSDDNDDYLPKSIEDIQQFLFAPPLKCPARQSGDDGYALLPLQEREMAKIKNPHETPLAVCTRHKRHDIVLYADGHVEIRPKQNISQP